MEVEIAWVRGHSDETGNEYVDYLAKSALNAPINTTTRKIPVPLAVIKQKIKEVFDRSWQTRWKNTEECRHTRLMFPHVDRKRLERIKNWDRPKIG